MVRPFPALLLLLLTSLSGCVDDPAPARPVDEAPGVITDPGDFSYLMNGSAPGSHIHDYWNGEDTTLVVKDDAGCRNCQVSYGGDKGAILGRFRPEPGRIVPQGAAWIHANATWAIGGGEYGPVALFVKTANQSQSSLLGELQQGVTFSFPSTNVDNDPPHHRLSLWEFEVRARPPAGADRTTLQDFSVSLEIVAERGLPIPVYPPHPDLWNGTTELVLHSSTRDVAYDIDTPTFSACNGCLGYHPPDEGLIVPYDASHIDVVLTVTDGLPASFSLRYHGADTWDYEVAPVEEAGLDRILWRIPIDDKADSPYAKQSLWEFYVENTQPTDPVEVWKGTYEIEITAFKAEA